MLRSGIVSALKSRNVKVGDHRTSVRLEPELWAALEEIAESEGRTIHDICTALRNESAAMVGGLTSALRVYIVRGLRARINQRA